MILDNKPYTFDRVFRLAIFTAFVCALIFFLRYLSDILFPFALALLMAYLLNPFVDKLQSKISSRGGAVFLTLVALAVIVGIFGFFVIPLVGKEIAHAGKLITQLIQNNDLQAKAMQKLPAELLMLVQEFLSREELQEFLKARDTWSFVVVLGQKLLPGIWSILSGATGIILGIVGLFVILLYLIFLLLDFQKVKDGWKELIPLPWRESVVSFLKEFDGAMSQYFRAQAAVASIVGILFAIGFGLIGLPLGILLGLFIGLLNMVPYLQILGLIPAFFLAIIHSLETDMSFWVVLLLVGLVFVVVQVIQDGFLVPKIMGKVTGLSPAFILLSLSIWGKILGMLGLIIALPVTCLILAYYRRVLASQEVAEHT